MNTTMEKLFDTYGESVLKDLGSFPGREVDDLLNSLPIEESRRLDLFDQINRFYLDWSTDAFTAGLHLGLTLSNHDIRRFRPEQR